MSKRFSIQVLILLLCCLAMLSAAGEEAAFIPSTGSPAAPREGETGYWVTPMDITDEVAVWAAITAPVTVLDTGKPNGQKRQVVVREEPNEKGKGVGVVTCITQAVRVLEPGDDWTLIECYSSSFHNSKVKAWNMLVQGYVPTRFLKTVTPDQELGFVVDKLTQRLYIFREGKLYDTLLVSTGLTNKRQPYNETRSGEFLLQVPAVGNFRSDELYCAMGIRFNYGDLLHEVPYTLSKSGEKRYASTEAKLGTKASHGCIRVQRKKTPLGTSIKWIYENKRNNMKLLIWEDWQGRQIPVPSADTPLYYNPKKGESYHSASTCSSAQNGGLTLTAFTYGELEDMPYSELKRCDCCCPPLREAEIGAINAKYAPGGDHDPVMTEARKKQKR